MYYVFFITVKTPQGRKRAAFCPTYYDDVLHFRVSMEDVCPFLMIRDEDGFWRILASSVAVEDELPNWVQENELKLNSFIETAASYKTNYLDEIQPHISGQTSHKWSDLT